MLTIGGHHVLATDVVDPAPVGVEHNGVLARGAGTTGGTLLGGELGVSLSSRSAGLLGVGLCHEGDEGKVFLHFDFLLFFRNEIKE